MQGASVVTSASKIRATGESKNLALVVLMTVVVYIWPGELATLKTGHASLRTAWRTGRGVYISYWPGKKGSGPAAKTVPAGKLGRNASNLLFKQPFTWRQSLSEDIAAAGEPPGEEIRIRGLDEEAIEGWWRETQTNPDGYFNLLRMNCSTVARDALRVGYKRSHVSRVRRFHPKHILELYTDAFADATVWGPSDVAEYARHLQWLMEG